MADRLTTSKSIVSGSFYTITRSLGILLAGSVVFIYVAKLLPEVQDLGLVHALVTLTTVSALVSCIGLPYSASRFMSYYYGKERADIAADIGFFILLCGITSSSVIAILIYLSSSEIATILLHDAHLAYLIRFVALDGFLVSIISFCNYMLYSQFRFKRVSLVSILNSALRFILPLFLLILNFKTDAIIIGFIISDGLSLALLAALMIPTLGRNLPRLKYVRSVFRFSLPLFGAQVVGYLSVNIDYFLLMYMSTLYYVGIYSPAVLFSTSLIIFINALGDVILPYSSRLYGRLGSESLADVSKFVSRYIFLIFVPFGFSVVICTQPLMVLFFGDKYGDSVYPSMILSSAVTLTSLGFIFNNILMAAGKSRDVFIGNTLALPVQVGISTFLIPVLGALGAALARCSALTIVFGYSSYRLRKLSSFEIDRSAIFFGLGGTAIMSIIIYFLNQYIGYAFLPFNITVGCGAYFLFLRYLNVLKTEDSKVFLNFLPRNLRNTLLLVLKTINR